LQDFAKIKRKQHGKEEAIKTGSLSTKMTVSMDRGLNFYGEGVRKNFANHQSFTMFASSNKPNSPGETIHQTYPTAVKGHYGGIVSRPV
jgi:hypothetical protein